MEQRKLKRLKENEKQERKRRERSKKEIRTGGRDHGSRTERGEGISIISTPRRVLFQLQIKVNFH